MLFTLSLCRHLVHDQRIQHSSPGVPGGRYGAAPEVLKMGAGGAKAPAWPTPAKAAGALATPPGTKAPLVPHGFNLPAPTAGSVPPGPPPAPMKELLHLSDCTAVVDLTAGACAWSLSCLEQGIPYFGIVLTEMHLTELHAHLVTEAPVQEFDLSFATTRRHENIIQCQMHC